MIINYYYNYNYLLSIHAFMLILIRSFLKVNFQNQKIVIKNNIR